MRDYLEINNVLYEYFLRDSEGNIESIKTALEGINLSVKPGDFISIIGANGSGKSTLARLINALITPAEGTVVVNGLDTKVEENTLDIRKVNAMVFQNPDNQIVAGVVEEDVAFGPENLGIESGTIQSRVKSALAKVGLWDKRRTAPHNLSGGEKQKLAIAGVLAMSPKCVIFDEATAMLDPESRKEIISTAYEMNKKQGMTVILITHYIEETIGSDMIYVMDSGKIIKSGPPLEIFSYVDYLEEHRLEVPSMVKLAHRLRQNGVPVPLEAMEINSIVEFLVNYKHAYSGR